MIKKSKNNEKPKQVFVIYIYKWLCQNLSNTALKYNIE